MNKRFLNFLLVINLIGNLIVGVILISRQSSDFRNLLNGNSVLDLSLVSFFVLMSIGLLAVIMFKKPRLFFGNFVDRFLNISEKYFISVAIVLVLLVYETFQDILFIQTDIATLHYPGYRQILIDFFPMIVWIFFMSIQALIILLVSRKEYTLTLLDEPSGKKWIYLTLIIAGLVLFFNYKSIGVLPPQYEQKWFEELNSPLIGLQVLLLLLALIILIPAMTALEGKLPWVSKVFSDRSIFIILALIAFLTWNDQPIKATTFTDIPRPPNHEFYPRSDALGYQLSAQELLNGGGSGRTNHIGFIQYLSISNLITGNNVRYEYLLRLLIISLIPALLFLITKELHTRLAGLLVGSLFIIREANAIILVDFMTIPQLRDGMTEPLTIVVLALSLFLLITGLKKGNKNEVLFILAGGLFGWLILLRIEALIYIAAIGLGITLYLWKSRQDWIKTIVIFALGLFLVAGPWFISTVITTGSIKSVALGKTNLIRKSYKDFSEGDEVSPESGNFNKRELFPFNLGNNIMSLLYYFPSNHQPLLTVKNLPDLFLSRIDPSDLEGNTFKEKYFERYLRSLPFWWNDWDGHLPARSFIPLISSMLLISYGFIQMEKDQRILGGILVGLALSHILLYSFVGKSGGRFIQVVDWVPMIFYGIGISGVNKSNIGSLDHLHRCLVVLKKCKENILIQVEIKESGLGL